MGKFKHLFKPRFMEKEIDEIIYYTEQRNLKLKGLIEQFGAEKPVDFYKVNRRTLKPQTHLHPGYGTCPGCGAGMVLNQMATVASAIAGNNIIYVNNTSCIEVSTVADGISTTYKILKAKGLYKGEVPYVVHIGGDGSTYDIGFQFLKAALIRTSSFVEMNEYLSTQK